MASKSSEQPKLVESSNPINVAKYYLNTMKIERDRIINLAAKAEREHDVLQEKGDVDEDVLGHIRSTAGKARLLATKKFKQFEGLCDDTINQTARDIPPPTSADLLGFWEMVYLQVENIDELFEELSTMRVNGWRKPIQPKPKQQHGVKLKKRPQTAPKGNASGSSRKSDKSVSTQMKKISII